MIYSYACSCGTRLELNCRIGQHPQTVCCQSCGKDSGRDYGADFAGVTFAPVDPFRSYDLSTAKTRAEGEQQRAIDAPRDSFERKHLEQSLGRTYVGNDTSMMSKRAQDGIAAYREKMASK